MAAAFLRRFDITLNRPLSASDGTRVPFAAAQIDFYRQGATVSGEPVVINAASSETVSVYDLGGLAASEAVMVGPGGASLSVTQIISPCRLSPYR